MVAVVLVAGSACSDTGTSNASGKHGVSKGARAGSTIELLPLSTSPDRRIVDSAGRDILLRGVNVNSLAEYWQGVPELRPNLPVTGSDWDSMAAHGFSVVRLLLSWSRVEPQRDRIDRRYLDLVDGQVRAAAARGIYTVLDFHQDAYTASIHTEDPASCPAATTPAKGWDGAPAWATITDGLSTCLPNGERNSSPAVVSAWNRFYDDTDGIRSQFTKAWAAVAARFSGRPEIAGFDLLNEPETSRPAAELTPIYDELLAQTIAAIRAAEHGAAFEHLIFVEPTMPSANPSMGLVVPNPAAAGASVHDVVASAHNYAESITGALDLRIETMNDLIETLTSGLGVASWTGEYGWWSASEDNLAKARRFAADEDRRRWGGAWWQWRQSCGDPHALSWNGRTWVPPDGDSVHLNILSCPDNRDLGPNRDFLEIVGRGYARAAPGRLTQLLSDPMTGELSIAATADRPGGELVVWTPTPAGPAHRVSVEGLVDVTERTVGKGRIITARVDADGEYLLHIGA